MLPHERSLVKKLADKPFALIGVNSDPDMDDLLAKNKKAKISWRNFWDGPKGTSGPIARSWNVQGWPTIYLIDHEGRIQAKNIYDMEAIDAKVEEMVKAAEGAQQGTR